MTDARDEFPAEHEICRNCGHPIIRWPNFSERWVHNPRKGFRVRRCRHGSETIAEPRDE